MMIIATGIDLIEIERIRQAMNRSPRFLDRIMTEKEKDQLLRKDMRASSAAGSFAAKEAVSKVLGTGIGEIAWREIEILNDGNGAPHVVLHGKALLVAERLGINHILVSITHDRDVAIASALGQQINRKEG
jgi:holo-[acyl-carrier protein] synthase